MSNCDCEENIKKPIRNGPTIAATVVEKPIGDGLLIISIAGITAVILFGLRVVSVGQQGALLMPTSLVHWLYLLAVRSDD